MLNAASLSAGRFFPQRVRMDGWGGQMSGPRRVEALLSGDAGAGKETLTLASCALTQSIVKSAARPRCRIHNRLVPARANIDIGDL